MYDWAVEAKKLVPMVAGATVMLIVTKPKGIGEALGGFTVGILFAFFAGPAIWGMLGLTEGTSSAASAIMAFAGNNISIRTAAWLKHGKLPFIGGRYESK